MSDEDSCCSTSAHRSQAQAQVETSVASSSRATPLPSASLPSPFEPALTLPRTHGHHVATLHLRSHGPGEDLDNLQFFCDFALRAGYALGIPLSKPASLPTRTSLWTVLKGPFVHKKSQENFQRRVHKRVIKVWDADIEVVDRWLHFLRIHSMGGVGMRAEIYRNLPLSIGATLLAASTSQLRSIPDDAQNADDTTMRASESDSEQVSKLARAIIQEEIAKQDAEDLTERRRIEPVEATSVEAEVAKETTEGADESDKNKAVADDSEVKASGSTKTPSS